MKLSRFRPAFLAFLCSAGFLHADVVVLKDGKRLEGNITAENPTSIHMRYKLTAKIWDDKDIPRSDIAEIIKQKPEEVELIELRKDLPTPDLMTAEKYESLIQDRLRPFVNRYPGTKEAAEVEKIIEEVREEKEKVVAGGVKVRGKWLTAEEAKAQSYNLRAYEIYSTMREKAQAKDYVGALQAFDKLSPPPSSGYGTTSQGGYLASIYYPKAVEEVLVVLNSFEGQVDQMIKDQPALQKQREDNFKKLIEPDLSRTKTAIEKEIEHWKTSIEAERRNSRWFTPYKYDLSALKALSSTITAEKARLKQVDVAKMTKVNEAIERLMVADAKASKDKDALKAMGEAILEGETAAAAMDQQTAGSYMTIFQGYRQRYAASQAILAAQAAQVAAPAAAAAAGSSAIGGTATPGVDARMAAALAGGTAPAPGATPPPAGQQAPGAMAQPAPAGTQPGMAPAPAPGAAAQAPAAPQPGVAAPAPAVPQQPAPPVAQPQPPAAPVIAEEPAPEGGLSTNMMLMIGIGVLVLVLVVVMSSGKKKKQQDA